MLNQIVAGLMLGEGLVFGVVAYGMFRRRRARLASWRRTSGEVIEVRERSGGEATTRHPVVRYKTATGEDATFESKYGSSSWKIQSGDRLEILVNPNDSADAEVVNFMAQWALPFVLAVVSAGSIIGAPLVYLLLRL